MLSLRRLALTVVSCAIALPLFFWSSGEALALLAYTVQSATCSATSYSALNSGDTVTVTYTIGATGTANGAGIFNNAGGATLISTVAFPNSANTTYTRIFTLFAKPTSGTLYIAVDTDSNTTALNCNFASATPAVSDSEKIRALQTTITTMVATTSGQVITSAIDGGISDGFSNAGTPTFLVRTAVSSISPPRRSPTSKAAPMTLSPRSVMQATRSRISTRRRRGSIAYGVPGPIFVAPAGRSTIPAVSATISKAASST
ncbi:MAG: hypothetical protein WDN48_11420 [Pseudolabrys sp.]